MDEPLQTYQKTLKLPCDGLQSGLPHKTILDAKDGISAECRIAALDKAAAATELNTILKIIGAIVGSPAFFAVESLILKLFHFVEIPVLFIVFAVICGLWCGSKLGALLGTAWENRALRRAEKKGVMTEADTLWYNLTQKLDLITREYERV